MLPEFAVAVTFFLVLWLLGMPLSTLIQRKFEQPATAMEALGPAFGIAVTALVAGPAYMAIGPSEIWAWPMLLVLLTAAVIGLVFLRFRPTWDNGALISTASLAVALLAAAFCLAAPAIGGGFNRVVFNNNPSDTMMYLTLAESTRTATFDQVKNYAQGAAELVTQNPLALYSARFVGVLMRLTTFIDLGWLSQISGIGVERLLWPFAFAMGLATASAAWGVARLMGVPYIIAALAAIVAAVGFWGVMPREADAYSHLQSMPLLLAIAALRIVDAQREKPSIALAVGVGLLLAAFVQVYTELLVLAVGVLFAEAFVRSITTRKPLGVAASFGISIVGMLLVLLLTGQLGYIAEITATQYKSIASGQAMAGFSFAQETRDHVFASVSGFAWLTNTVERLGAPRGASSALVWTLAASTLAAATLAGARTLWSRQAQPTTIVAAAAATGVAMALVAFFLRDDVYVFQKAMTSAAPFSLLLIAALASWSLSNAILKRIAIGGAAAVLSLQLLFPGMAVARDLRGEWPTYSRAVHEGRNYDLAELNRRLDEVCPCELLVNVPPQRDWWFAAYVSLSVARHSPYYQMGYFFNNAPRTVLVPGIRPMTAPRYAIMHYSDDYVGIQRMGDLIYDAGYVRLYSITNQDSAAFAPRAVSQ